MKSTEISDYSVGTVWLVRGDTCYLLHVIRDRLEYPALKRAVLEARHRWNVNYTLIEDKGSGISLIQDLRRENVAIIQITPDTDKLTRLYSVQGKFESNSVFFPVAQRNLKAAVTAEQALGDLPPIYARQQLASGKLRRGARRFDQAVPHDGRRTVSSYAQMMRSWPGFEAPADGLKDHVIRYLPRDYELFARLEPGDQYPQAYQHALNMLAERLANLGRRGKAPRKGTAEYERLHKAIVPPYDAGKFPNKWRKMWRDQPARTLMAHLGRRGSACGPA